VTPPEKNFALLTDNELHERMMSMIPGSVNFGLAKAELEHRDRQRTKPGENKLDRNLRFRAGGGRNCCERVALSGLVGAARISLSMMVCRTTRHTRTELAES